jgi:hypothetical protein
MEIELDESLFTNGTYSLRYGEDKEALFIIVDEEFPGNGRLGRVDCVMILTRTYDARGAVSEASLRFGVIGLGDGAAGVKSPDASLAGKHLKRSNMAKCTVVLYE